MKRMIGVMAGVIALVGCTSDPDTGRVGAAHLQVDAGQKEEDAGRREDAGPPPGLCRMTGGGQIDVGEDPDSFGGNAAPRRGDFTGEWNHVTHEGQHFHGHTINFVACFVNANDEEPPEAGFAEIVFRGEGTFEGEDCTFEVEAEDHGEGANAPARDEYTIRIDCPTTDYETPDEEEILHGNIQIHPLPPGFL
ncbi:Hypothetical protein I5071_58310 [Sandaracinus amylolyticus]|nr:Hypothetical protein I5071_58310 [Sandaracinus amylolyticus]